MTKDDIKIAIRAGITSRIQAHKKRQRKKIFTAASIILLPILVISLWLQLPADHHTQLHQYSTSKGQTEILYLKDGSRLTLAGNTSITISEADNGSAVTLHAGECYFEIEKQQYPFRVITNDTRTTVLGTAFTVSKPIANQPAEIRLKHGKISVTASLLNTIILPGERVYWNPTTNAFQKDSISIDAIGNFTANRIVWDKLNIAQIIYHIENRFPVSITASPDVLAQQHQYSLSFNRSISIEDLIDILSAITSDEKLKFDWKQKSQSINITK